MMRTNRINRIAVFLGALLMVFLISCNQASNSTEPAQGSSGLSGTEWTLSSIDSHLPIEDTDITLQFDNGFINGYGGCNRYGAKYEVRDTALSFSDIGSTARDCGKPMGVLEQEKVFLDRLRQITNYRVTGDRLELDNLGDIVLVFTSGE